MFKRKKQFHSGFYNIETRHSLELRPFYNQLIIVYLTYRILFDFGSLFRNISRFSSQGGHLHIFTGLFCSSTFQIYQTKIRKCREMFEEKTAENL